MKRRIGRVKKKGAIQMSMQTIIVVVIGVTLLTLGLKFVYDTFKGIGEKQQKMEELTEGQLEKLFEGDEEPVNIPRSEMKMKSGSSDSVKVTLVNTAGEEIKGGKLKLVVGKIPSNMDKDDVESWFIYDDSPFDLGSTKAIRNTVAIDVGGDAVAGTYLVSFVFDCTTPKSVCGSKETLIIRVTA